jgi:hypothetical protein
MAPAAGPPGDPHPSNARPSASEPPGSTETVVLLQRELRPDLEVLRHLGSGSAGEVFLAREPRLNRLVAVKVLSKNLAGDHVARVRFEREARAAAALNHPNAVAVHRFGYLSNEVPYLVMQYVNGVTLEDKVAAEGLLSAAEARRVLAEVADALAAAHKRGFVHRDLRPENVLCDRESGRVLVSDFGLAGVLPGSDASAARITQTGQILGIPEYASPEQLRGEDATEGSDVYALGVMGYELLTGQGPFRITSGLTLAAAHLRSPPRPLTSLREDVDEPLADLLERCLAKEPAKRPGAAYLARAFREGLDAVPEPGRGPATVTGRGVPGQGDVLAAVLRRRLPQIVAVTAVVGYALLTFIDQLADRGVLPELYYLLSLSTFIYGVVASGVIAWFHGKTGQQRIMPLEVVMLSLVGSAWLLTCLIIVLA